MKTVQDEEWTCGLEAVRRSAPPVRASVGVTDAPAIIAALKGIANEVSIEEWDVELDGFRSSASSVYARRDGKSGTLKIPENDTDLFLKAKALAAGEEPQARVRVRVEPEGLDARSGSRGVRGSAG